MPTCYFILDLRAVAPVKSRVIIRQIEICLKYQLLYRPQQPQCERNRYHQRDAFWAMNERERTGVLNCLYTVVIVRAIKKRRFDF